MVKNAFQDRCESHCMYPNTVQFFKKLGQKFTFLQKSTIFDKFSFFSFQRGVVHLCSSKIVEVLTFWKKYFQNVRNTQLLAKILRSWKNCLKSNLSTSRQPHWLKIVDILSFWYHGNNLKGKKFVYKIRKKLRFCHPLIMLFDHCVL